MEAIGKIIATEKQPSTIEEFTFWTRKDLKLKPFDVVVVDHVMDAQGEPDQNLWCNRRNFTHDGLAECFGGLYFQ